MSRWACALAFAAVGLAQGCGITLRTVREPGPVVASRSVPETRDGGPVATEATTDGDGLWLRVHAARECRETVMVTREEIVRNETNPPGALTALWLGTAAAAAGSAAAFLLFPYEGMDIEVNGDDAGTVPWGVVLAPIAVGFGGTALYYQVKVGFPERRRLEPVAERSTEWEQCGLDAFAGPVEGTLALAEAATRHRVTGEVGPEGWLALTASSVPSPFWRVPRWDVGLSAPGRSRAGTSRSLEVTGDVAVAYRAAIEAEAEAEAAAEAERRREQAEAARQRAAEEAKRRAAAAEVARRRAQLVRKAPWLGRSGWLPSRRLCELAVLTGGAEREICDREMLPLAEKGLVRVWAGEARDVYWDADAFEFTKLRLTVTWSSDEEFLGTRLAPACGETVTRKFDDMEDFRMRSLAMYECR